MFSMLIRYRSPFGSPDPKIYLGFTMCLSRNYPEIPQHSLVGDCALEHGIDIAQLNECAVKDDGGHAMEMLRNSVRRSTEVCKIITKKKGGSKHDRSIKFSNSFLSFSLKGNAVADPLAATGWSYEIMHGEAG